MVAESAISLQTLIYVGQKCLRCGIEIAWRTCFFFVHALDMEPHMNEKVEIYITDDDYFSDLPTNVKFAKKITHMNTTIKQAMLSR